MVVALVGDLTRNFSRSELDCPCCGTFIRNDRLLRGLQTLRDLVGGPIHVNSGTRCWRHNSAVGGSPKSQHVDGAAADIWAYGATWKQLAALAETVPEFASGGIGRYPKQHFIHVDVGPKRRWIL